MKLLLVMHQNAHKVYFNNIDLILQRYYL